ncbi:FxSxx-COOH cyclophane-containing RiPP peptide [Streptomyces aureus]|uniref:FxSxx-COOH cyclophane-containing RiPP peptide n=1 Tax=Streptomyces aureus TaxID=193461 RepID=UPI0033FECC75
MGVRDGVGDGIRVPGEEGAGLRGHGEQGAGAEGRTEEGDRPTWSPGPAGAATVPARDGLTRTSALASPSVTPDPADLPVPDPLDLDLAQLRSVRHPVLDEVLADLRSRSGEPSEMLWGFNNAF